MGGLLINYSGETYPMPCDKECVCCSATCYPPLQWRGAVVLVIKLRDCQLCYVAVNLGGDYSGNHLENNMELTVWGALCAK